MFSNLLLTFEPYKARNLRSGNPSCALSACPPAALPTGCRTTNYVILWQKHVRKQVVSSKVPALRLLLANCGFHDWSAHAQMIFIYFTTMSHILWVHCHIPWQVVTHIVTSVGHICVTTCATYVSQLVPHMCHNLSHICVTTCTKYLSHFVNRGGVSVKCSNASFEPLWYSKYSKYLNLRK